MATIDEKISEEKIAEKTGRPFSEWKKIIDKLYNEHKSHTKVAALLVSDYNVSGWWAQSLVVKYEWQVGIKKEIILTNELKQHLLDLKLLDKFNSLSPSHKREYLNAIYEAKKEETKSKRISLMINYLQGLKQ